MTRELFTGSMSYLHTYKLWGHAFLGCTSQYEYEAMFFSSKPVHDVHIHVPIPPPPVLDHRQKFP